MRRLYNLITLLSFLLALLLITAWPLSHFRRCSLSRGPTRTSPHPDPSISYPFPPTDGEQTFAITAYLGSLTLDRNITTPANGFTPARFSLQTSRITAARNIDLPLPSIDFLGFRFAAGNWGFSSDPLIWTYYRAYLTIPFYALIIIALLLPAQRLYNFLKSRRCQPGLCPTCHYDLRAHAPGQICPECGTSIRSPSPHSSRMKPAMASPVLPGVQ